MDPLELAIELNKVGFAVIPLKGKRPFLPRWQNTLTGDASLEKVLNAYKKDKKINIGIVTGVNSNIVVVDIDSKQGGISFWKNLTDEYGDPQTFIVRTGGGGYHYYFQLDENTKQLRNAIRALKGKGVDFKTTGGQVVAPCCIHPETGKQYVIINGYDEKNGIMFINPMPSWLFELLKSNQEDLDSKYKK